MVFQVQSCNVKITILVMLLSACVLVRADEWTPADTRREAVYAALILMDWRQTQDITRHKNIDESNEMLGEDPRNGKINRYFVAAGVLATGDRLHLANRMAQSLAVRRHRARVCNGEPEQANWLKREFLMG